MLVGNSEHEDEGDVPMAQRKRFTRVEMARVLMERNQYKERFMELQDAVRWTEMMRASKVETLDKKSKQSVWKFFSNLFSTNDRPQREPPPMFRTSPSHQVGEGRGFQAIGGNSSSNALVLAKDFNDEGTSERAIARRREQYRQVRAHVAKEDGRLQAYGWSLPGAKTGSSGQQNKHAGNVPVPVPVYCRPLAEASPHMKVWCASGVNLNGGYTKDGGCMVGASVFYSQKPKAKITEITTPTGSGSEITELESLDKQITLAMENVDQELQLSSYVWICTSTHSASTVTVIDAKNPAEVLDSFPVCNNHLLTICTVIGALEKDYRILESSEVTKAGETLEKPGEPGDPDEIGRVEFVRVEVPESPKTDEANDGENIHDDEVKAAEEDQVEKASEAAADEVLNESNEIEQATHAYTAVVEDIIVPPISPLHSPMDIPTNPINPISGSLNPMEESMMSSVGPTMWLGAQNGMVFVHSSVGRWRTCLHKVMLPDAVLSIVHVESRVVVALANGKLAIFRRQTNGEWDVNSFHLLTLGSPKQSVRCLTVVGDKVWAAHRNKIHVVDPMIASIVHTMEAHPRKESQIRQMAATGLGVWVSIR